MLTTSWERAVQVLVDSSVWIAYFTGKATPEADHLHGLFWHVELSGFDLAEKTAVNYHTLQSRNLPVRTAQRRLATFCIDQGYALLHASEGYEPFERHLGLTVARG